MDNFKKQKSETIDICRNNLIDSVTCNKPSSEGYDVKNLISSNFVQKSKGFMVERFISPPITLTFQFKCSIYIQYIAVYCKVGAQKTSGIEILSQLKPESEYVSIGSVVLQDSENGIVFHRYNEQASNKFGEQYLLRTFKPKSCPHLSSVTRLQIKIFRTSCKSVPCLGKVEFWGIPRKAQHLNKCEVRICDKLSSSVGLSEVVTPAIDLGPNIRGRKPNYPSSNLNSHQSVSVPEDFLDPITFEVMSQPVIMPSGKIIDNTTLESHEKAERIWGRGPNDPFTGVPFTDSNKPVAATDLKARIDQYLSIHSDCTELYNIPRTVGRIHSYVPSRGVSKASVSKLIKPSTSISEFDCNSATVSSCENEIKAKRRKIDLTSTGIPSNRDAISQSIKSDKITNNSIFHGSRDSNKYSSFQERMEQSLEIALKSTLSKLPNLTADKPTIEEITISCNVCKSVDNLFSIPCNHSVCRSCLIGYNNKTQMSCLLCCFKYKTSDVKKIHVLK